MVLSFFRSQFQRFIHTAADAKEFILKNRETLNTALQWYNFSVAVLVTVDFIRNMRTENTKNPVEYGSDIAVHLLQWSLSLSSGLPKKLASLAANGYRTIDIPLRMLLQTSTVPGPIAVVDALNHFVNTVGTTAAVLEPEIEESRLKHLKF